MFDKHNEFGGTKPLRDQPANAAPEGDDGTEAGAIAAIGKLTKKQIFKPEITEHSPKLRVGNYETPAGKVLAYLNDEYGLPVLEALYERVCAHMPPTMSKPEKIFKGNPPEEKRKYMMRVALLTLLGASDRIKQLHLARASQIVEEFTPEFRKFVDAVDEKRKDYLGAEEESQERQE